MRHLGLAADITMDITPPTRWRTGGLRQSVDRPRPGHTLARRRVIRPLRENAALCGALLIDEYVFTSGERNLTPHDVTFKALSNVPDLSKGDPHSHTPATHSHTQ